MRVPLTAGDRTINVVTRRDPLQRRIHATIDTTSWDRARTH